MDTTGNYEAWSTMALNSTTRATFISNLLSFIETYNFDGVDLDWEYPFENYGRWADTGNFVNLVKEMRAAFGTKYGMKRSPLLV